MTAVADIDDSIKRKRCRVCRIQRFQVEFLKNGLSLDHEFLHAYPLSWTIGRTNLLIRVTSIVISGRLQNAIKYCTKVHKNGYGRPMSRITQPLFNPESLNFARTSMPTCSIGIPDMTSPFTSCRHLSKFEKKRPKMSYPTV